MWAPVSKESGILQKVSQCRHLSYYTREERKIRKVNTPKGVIAHGANTSLDFYVKFIFKNTQGKMLALLQVCFIMSYTTIFMPLKCGLFLNLFLWNKGIIFLLKQVAESLECFKNVFGWKIINIVQLNLWTSLKIISFRKNAVDS